MKTFFSPIKPWCVIVLLSLVSTSALAYNLREYSSKNGLSNSAILSMCQDNNGLMWFGTCEGLNMFDGVKFQVYNSINSQNNLSGKLIGAIIDAGNNTLWVQTNYGLDRFDSRTQTICSYKEFNENNKLIKNSRNEIYIAKEDNYLYFYEQSDESFHRVYIEDFVFEDLLEMAVDDQNTLWFFAKGGKYRSYELTRKGLEIRLETRNYFNHTEEVLWCFYNENLFHFIDSNHDLYEYDTVSKRKSYIRNLHTEIAKLGEVSCFLKYQNDYFIGFKTSGLIQLQNTPELKTRFLVHEIDIKSGIFCLMKDRFQDIIWVGTDGQGVFMYFINQYTIKSTLFSTFDFPVNNPARALFIDKERTLWIGTKGNGIIRIPNYDVLVNSGNTPQQILTSNSLLKDNSVYVFAKSKKNILWIGSEDGINYYSYKDRKIKNIHITINDKPVKYVHSICEFNDTTLWIATLGEGIVKAKLKGTPDVPEITNANRFVFGGGKMSSNYFFTSYQENDSIIWFGNRGHGAFRVNNNTHNIETFTFDEHGTNLNLNDVFSITQTDNGYWFGTSYGLTQLSNNMDTVLNDSNGLPHKTIHGILRDSYNNLWLSTNHGVVEFNTQRNTFRTYKQQNEFEVSEFSDGASFKDPLTNILFFGGVNGYITIFENEYSQHTYHPSIQFNQLSIFGKECNYYDYLSNSGNKEELQLKYNQNIFSVGFTAIDYINGNDYTYYYKINELSENWIKNGSFNQASFTNIAPGNYVLQVKYRNNITGEESETESLHIRILPPWYRTNLAYLIYTVLIILLILTAVYLSTKWYRFKQNSIMEKLNTRKQEEIYESKLRFFTNITHELSTPLTLISGPCEKIITYTGTDNYIKKYTTLIKHNAEKLNGLIQELIEFRRLETGHKTVDINKVSVSELTRNIAESFSEIAESKGYEYYINIAKNISWNSDAGCLSKIITNLISNAFKYTFDQGKIWVELFIENKELHIVISNTGKGIKEENISKIFDRYTILDNFEVMSKREFSPRNGLGLAICNHNVQLLEGEIQVKSVLNETTSFTVILPELQTEKTEAKEEVTIEPVELSPISHDVLPVPERITLPAFDKTKQSVLVIDDEPAMLWFISQIFIEKYNVFPINDPNEVLPFLKERVPDLIISDVMMPDIDGISLLKSIKKDKLLKHIPFILLSARNDAEEQVRGIESGAEVYVTKPFNVEYLEKIVTRLLQRKEDLKEYYTSPLSSFELHSGKLTHVEEQEFIDKLLRCIEQNLSNPGLSAELLSTNMGVSVRQLYRKSRDITSKTPSELIKEQRLSTVERLLITSNLSVDEIMHKTGFHNRGHFFKVFAQRFGTTPKNYRDTKKNEALS
ncbi:two-component regulator propeller domain-containing protein [Bacteroides sp. 519]|uniref:hybrid sensor histidine kinase/response regulator transcription factor n=1 Tax=Bacteroides sp. 519 TaxID=2302937 RepID=UPI0013CF4DEE|nr:two-component regulator propeller domain-containing protein [Bacteroides sp. 519]NDV58150.1 response regulator [Bacteroides sp. 519]